MKGFTNAINNSKDNIETLNVTLKTNQQENTDLVGVGFTLSYGNYTKSFTWEGRTMTIEVPAYVTYTITYEGVEDYKKPEDVTFTAHGGNSRSVTALYKTELVDIALSSSDGSSVNGAVVLINGKSRTWDGTNIKQKVAFGTEYSVEPQSLDGFTTPSSRSFVAEQAVRELSFTYIASALKVNILSNQSTDSSWDPTITNIKATVKYGSTTLQVSNGQQINLPSGVNVTISFPEVEGYLKPEDITFTHNGGLVEKSGTYKCELLTVNVSADQGSVSGFEVTISKQEVVGVATKYTRLEYIESTGTQYIDTGFVPNQDTRVVARLACPVTGSTNWAFGARTSASSNNFGFAASTNDCYTSGYNNSQIAIDSSYNTSEAFDLEKNKNITYINGASIATGTYASFTCPYSLALFACNSNGSITYGKVRMYSFQVYDNEILVRDYIPVLRPDGIAGLYDAVNDAFCHSNGTGNFTYGSIEHAIVAVQTSVTGSYKIPFDTSYTVQANSVSGYTSPASVTRIASAVSHVLEQKYEVIKVKDLSLFDVYGNPIQRSTANCYVVREAGQYKFPCIYGNAIKNDKRNEAAYTNNGGSYSHDFVNYAGHNIQSPWMNGAEARLLNADCENVISNLLCYDEFDNSFISFSINEIPDTGANIIIGVYSNFYNSLLWSWHIWLWPHDLSPVEITNSTGVKYNIMPVNLASKYDSDGVHIKNWFYQWGRPNPMLLPSAWNSTTDHTPGSITKASKASDLQTGLSSPTTFYYNSPTGSMGIQTIWFDSTKYYNLWDAACTTVGSSDNDTVKTVYDPCPVGWKVPNGNVFTGMSEISYNDGVYKLGRYDGDAVGVTFHMNTCRKYSSGDIEIDRQCVWTSAIAYSSGAYQASCLLFDYGFVYNKAEYLAGGQSIRPVQDDITDVDPIVISFTINGTSYAAESGMTWLQWTQSGYNTGGYATSGGGTVCHGGSIYKALKYNGNNVMKTDVVIGGAAYTHST